MLYFMYVLCNRYKCVTSKHIKAVVISYIHHQYLLPPLDPPPGPWYGL